MPNDLFKNYWFGMMLSFAEWFLKHFTTEQEPDRSNNAFLKPQEIQFHGAKIVL